MARAGIVQKKRNAEASQLKKLEVGLRCLEARGNTVVGYIGAQTSVNC